jgi:hypothetical protein
MLARLNEERGHLPIAACIVHGLEQQGLRNSIL